MNNIVYKLVRVGVAEGEQSLTAIKSIIMLTRLCLISMAIVVLYVIILLSLDLLNYAIVFTVILQLFIVNYFIISRRMIGLAKIYYASLVIGLISLLSVLFGRNTGIEYWMVITGSISLLIFKRKEFALNFVMLSIVSFILLEAAQNFIPPLLPLPETMIPVMLPINVTIILCTAFTFSYILRYSSEDFEKRVRKSNEEVVRKNHDLTDSIRYAYRIQSAVLPTRQVRERFAANLMVIFEPRDIVSGDFYWIYPLPDRLLFAVVDGSAHSVAGALISIMAHAALTQSVEEFALRDTREIVARFSTLIAERRSAWNDPRADRIDITLMSYEWDTLKLSYSSNGNSIYLIKHVNSIDDADEIEILDDSRYAMKEIRKQYKLLRSPLRDYDFIHGSHLMRKDDMVYLVTKGLASQLGGPKFKKLKAGRLKNLLMSVQHLSLQKQEHIISDLLRNWKGKHPRTDDVTLLGFKV